MSPKNASSVFMVLLVATSIHQVLSHGRLMDPPARNSMWRFGFPNPVNYNDNELYCGGKMVQWVRNKGKCGVCGDPWHGVRHHETGGKYANGIISRSYTEGENIKVDVQLTANHLGWFEFRICPIDNPETEVTQKCLDQHLLYSTDGHISRFLVTKGKNSIFFNFTVKLPVGLVCEQCVFQWKYRTGNTWDKDDKSGIFCLGCGPQEEFYNCADITIEPLPGQNDYSSKSRNNVKTETVERKDTVGVKISSKTIPILTPTTSATALNQWKGNEKTRKANLFDWFNQLSLKSGRNPYLINKDAEQKSADKIKKFFQINSKTMRLTISPPTMKLIPKITNLAQYSNKNSQRNTKLKISKSRADMSVDKIYSTREKLIETTISTFIPTRKRITLAKMKSQGRKPSREMNIERTGISTKRSFKMFSNPVSTGQNWLIKDNKITTQGFDPTISATPKVLLPSKPCHRPKTMRKRMNKMSKIVASPVGRFDLGWWGEHYFRPPAASRITSTWPIKPVLKCRAIILLSGGMDDWCFVNCNANYCPSNLCQCRRELSYTPLYTSSNNHVVRQSLSSHVAEEDIQQRIIQQPVHLPLSNQLPSMSSQTNVALPHRNSQYSPVVNRCKAIGVHAGNVHFDQWCNRNCFSFWCPSSLCHCR